MITSKIVVGLFIVAIVGEVVPQHTENNIHIEETQSENLIISETTEKAAATTISTTEITTTNSNEIHEAETPNFIIRLYNIIVTAIENFFSSPRVKTVFHNVGICMVNGAMEIVTHYLPAPMIPLVASAAGLVIPFEPVVTLREKMPVTSYRRAFNKAVNSFMGTFDKYKEIEVDDPYMTKRFNRRFLKGSPEENNRRVSGTSLEKTMKSRASKMQYDE